MCVGARIPVLRHNHTHARMHTSVHAHAHTHQPCASGVPWQYLGGGGGLGGAEELPRRVVPLQCHLPDTLGVSIASRVRICVKSFSCPYIFSCPYLYQ